MNKLLVLVFLLPLCFAANIKSSRFVLPEENDINFKRYMPVTTKKTVDLLSESIVLEADAEHVTYYIYTKENPLIPIIIESSDAHNLQKTPFDPNKKTLVIIHGWIHDNTASVNILIRDAVMKNHDLNVIVVDWSPIAGKNYITAKNSVSAIGTFVGEFINEIINIYHITGDNFILIGHSLGAHVAGNAGAVTTTPISHIIGLDPAGPLFSLTSISDRLDETDAKFVQVIHTNGQFLGMASAIGDVDFYPNGGMKQPGCGLDLVGTCSHSRAFEYLAEAFDLATQFVAVQCSSYTDFEKNKCGSNEKGVMGEITTHKNVFGDFYLKTNSESPFALG